MREYEIAAPRAGLGIRLAEFARSGGLTPFAVPVAGFVLFRIGRRLISLAAHHSGQASLLLLILIAVLGVLLARIRYAQVPFMLRMLLRGMGLVVLVQVLFDSFGAVPPGPNLLFAAGDGGHPVLFTYGAAIAVFAGLAALLRPSFLLALFYYYVLFRIQISQLAHISIVDTDYLSMLDGACFGTIAALLGCVMASPRASLLMRKLGLTPPMRSDFLQVSAGLVWAVIVGAHLGNYFCSGMAKVLTGGTAPWTWLVYNPTQVAILNGLERGDNLLASWPFALQSSWDLTSRYTIVTNTFVLLVQLMAPLAMLRVRWLLVFTMLFDVFHVVVYLTLGALFHYWIAVNLIVYTSAWRMREDELTRPMKAVGIALALFGSPLFYTNWLGWLDGPKMTTPRFEALTSSGERVPVPANFFGIYSYTILQNQLYVPEGHFRARNGGNHPHRHQWQDALSCGPLVEEHEQAATTFETVRTLVINTDRFMRHYPFIKANNLYYFYPHHMQPNPASFKAFNALQMSDIVKYIYVVQSVCLDFQNGKLVRNVNKQSDFEIEPAGP